MKNEKKNLKMQLSDRGLAELEATLRMLLKGKSCLLLVLYLIQEAVVG